MQKNKTFTPLPIAFYIVPLSLIVLVGLIDSIYLSMSHYRNYVDISYQSFCALSKSINCDTVSQSRYAIFLNLPVPVWGILGYLFYLILLCFAIIEKHKNRLWGTLFIIGFLFTFYSIILALISTFIIHSYCMMCILSYFINLCLAFYPWFIHRRFSKKNYRISLKLDFLQLLNTSLFRNSILTFFVIAAFIFIIFPKYWLYSADNTNQNISNGITKDHSPWIGAKDNPALTINEYSDYLCFQCNKMHQYLRNLINENPDKIRLVHYNYPMDHKYNPIVKNPFHIGAGKIALFSIASSLNDNFWEINDKLYQLKQMNNIGSTREISNATGIDADILYEALVNKSIKKKLTYDIRKGMKLRITGTPSYEINGQIYQGTIPPAILNKALNK